MNFTEEMISEDEKRWHARNIVKELDYCGNYMLDRKNMTNLSIRFYAYIMRKAACMLKEQEPPSYGQLKDPSHYGKMYKCRKCGMEWYQQTQKYCQECGAAVRWE